MTDRQRNGFILLIVVGLLIGSLIVIAGVPGAVKSKKTVLGLDLKGGVELVYQGKPTAQSKVDSESLDRAIDIMRKRVDQLGVAQPEIQRTGGSEIDIRNKLSFGEARNLDQRADFDRSPAAGGDPRSNVDGLV